MKKSILAVAGLAAVAGVVGPVAGAFATDTSTHTDTITLTIDSACSFTAKKGTTATTTGSEYTQTVANGETAYFGGTASAVSDDGTNFTISCNDQNGWVLTAVGYSGKDGDSKNVMVASAGTNITSDSANDKGSQWQFWVNGTDAVSSYTNGYTTIPDSATKIAGTSSSISGSVIKVAYKVTIGATQESGTYTGKVKYTLSHPAAK